jgi:hypothetical protein
MELICPNCQQIIDPAHINVVTDLAQCAHCGALNKASELASSETPIPVRAEPPINSALQMTRELDSLVVVQTRRPMGCAQYFMFGFSTFWLCFVAFWTWGALQASFPFALFSIPFWMVGLGIMGTLLNGRTERQTMTIRRSSLALEKKRLLFPKKYEWDWRQIEAVRFEGTKSNSFSSINKVQSNTADSSKIIIQMPAVIVDGKAKTFFESADTEGQEWIVRYLASRLDEHKH